MEAADALRRLGGTARRVDLLERVSRRALARGLDAGDVERLARGLYAQPQLPSMLRTANSLSGFVSHESAATWWKLAAVLEPRAVHVTVPRSAARRRGKAVVLHYADIAKVDLHGDGRVTGPARTVLDCARTMPFVEALAIADSALRRELVTCGELAGRAAALAGPGSRRAARVVAHADGRSANPFESALRALAIDAGVGCFVPQVVVPGPPDRRVDLADEELRIVLEADSYTHHGSARAFARDCRRYNNLMTRDWLVLRFAWVHVMFHPDWVVDTIRRMVLLRHELYRRTGSMPFPSLRRPLGPN